jgi:glucose-1-phosphate thymidylyltransferase
VYNVIRTLKPSGRGELEITDVNNEYIARGEMTWEELKGWWTDAGTFESLLHASNLVAETGANKLPLIYEEVSVNA